MRKILLSVLMALLLIGAVFTIINGLEFGEIQIWGVKEIINQNEDIDDKNMKLSGLVSVKYPEALEGLNTSSETLTSTKQEYENKSILVSNSKYYMQTEKYEIEFLWIRLGNHAKDNNVQIKIEVVNSSTSGLYDLNFTVLGKYNDVTDFIYAIENDSKLGFKIEGFHMSSSDKKVQGLFTCKEININIEKLEENKEDTDNQQENNAQQTETNTDNTTNDESTQN